MKLFVALVASNYHNGRVVHTARVRAVDSHSAATLLCREGYEVISAPREVTK